MAAVCRVACGLSVALLIGFIVFGIVDADLASATVVGVLVSALFVDVGVLTSYWADRRLQFISGTIWVVMAVLLLIGVLVLLTGGKSDADLLLAYGTAILAFPIGLIAGPIAAQFSPTAGVVQSIVMWGIAVGAGTLQWFILLPQLVKRRNSN